VPSVPTAATGQGHGAYSDLGTCNYLMYGVRAGGTSTTDRYFYRDETACPDGLVAARAPVGTSTRCELRETAGAASGRVALAGVIAAFAESSSSATIPRPTAIPDKQVASTENTLLGVVIHDLT
jgi:hypothetical protein